MKQHIWFIKFLALITLLCTTTGLVGCRSEQAEAAAMPLHKSAPNAVTEMHPELPVLDGNSEVADSSDKALKSPTTSEWELDERFLTDEYLLSLVLPMEVGMLRENAFVFRDPSELTVTQLYLAFLLLTDYSELEKYQRNDSLFYFPSDAVTAQLEKYLKNFEFDIKEHGNYDASVDAIVAVTASGFGGDRNMEIVNKTISENVVTFTAAFFDSYEKDHEPFQTKTYGIEFYDGGYYFLSAIVE